MAILGQIKKIGPSCVSGNMAKKSDGSVGRLFIFFRFFFLLFLRSVLDLGHFSRGAAGVLPCLAPVSAGGVDTKISDIMGFSDVVVRHKLTKFSLVPCVLKCWWYDTNRMNFVLVPRISGTKIEFYSMILYNTNKLTI